MWYNYQLKPTQNLHYRDDFALSLHQCLIILQNYVYQKLHVTSSIGSEKRWGKKDIVIKLSAKQNQKNLPTQF